MHRGFRTLGVVVVALMLLAVAALAATMALDRHAAQESLGIPSREVALWLALAGAAILALAALLLWARRARPRAAVTALAIAAGLAGLAGLGGAVAVAATTTGCESFRFDRARWLHPGPTDDAVALADAVARCHVLTGLDRAGVEHLLGSPGVTDEQPSTPRSRTWVYGVAYEDAGLIGPAMREVLLRVRFGPDGRVTRARVQDETRTY